MALLRGGSTIQGYPLLGRAGTENYLTRFNGNHKLVNSLLYDNGTNVGVGNSNPSEKLDVSGNIKATSFLVGSTTVIETDGKIDWGKIKNTPSSFPPATHNHDGTYDNYGGWTISDGTNSENIGSGHTLKVVGSGGASVSYNSSNNTLTVNSTDNNTTYSAGAGISLSGTQFSHADTSTQSSSNNTGRTYIQGITLDTYGHITAISTGTETVTDTDNYVDEITAPSGAKGLLTLGRTGSLADLSVDLSHTHSWTEITSRPTLGTASSRNTGTTSGTIPLLDSSGKLPSSVLPSVAITDTFVVANQTAMLALVAETGDIAIRTDQSKTYILKGSNPSVLSDWEEILTPLDGVHSIEGQTGALTLNDIGAEPKFNKNTAFNKNFGTTAGTVAEGNHTHSWSQVSGKPSEFTPTSDLTSSFVWQGDQDYKGLYWGTLRESNSPLEGTWAFIRQGTTAGQIELGSDDKIDFYETDEMALAVSISTNTKTVNAVGGYLWNGQSLDDRYQPKGNYQPAGSYDNYGSWTLQANGGGNTTVNSGNSVNFVAGSNVTLSKTGNSITISSTDTNSNHYLTGVSGSGNGTVTFTRNGLSNLTWSSSHTHNNVDSIDDRDVKPANTPVSKVSSYFTTQEGMTGSSGTDYQDLLVMNTYANTSGGKVNALMLDKSSMLIKHYQANQGDTTWGTPKTIAYAEDLSWDNVSGKPTEFDAKVHNHDDRYYTESEIDSKLDKKAEVEKTNKNTIATAGWYRIAQNIGNRAFGKFVIKEEKSGSHQSVEFIAGLHYSNSPIINVLANSSYSSGGSFRYIRIVRKSTYDPVYVEVYVDNSSVNGVEAFLYRDIQVSGWDIIDWTAGEIPVGYSAVQVDLDKTNGFLTTDEIYAKSDKKVWHDGNVIGGGAITVSGQTISHTDTSSVSNLATSPRRYITSMNFDTYGHVTGYTTATETVTDSGWRPIHDSPSSGANTTSVSSNWAFNHGNKIGNLGHVPDLGSVGQFLAHDGTWKTPTMINNNEIFHHGNQPKIHTSTTEPQNPKMNDIWVEIDL